MGAIKENILLNAVFPLADKVMGTCAMRWYRQIREMNTWTREQVQEWQTHRLHLLINHAYNHTRYYREIMDERGLKPEDILTLEDIKKLPVLTREIILNRAEDLTPDNIQKYPHRVSSTGGSTGQPMRYLQDENTWGFTTAMKIFSWQQSGYHYGDLYVSLGSSSLFPVNKKSFVHEVYFRLRNTIPLNGMNMDAQVCRKYMDIIISHNVRYVYGYATAIYLLADYCVRNGVKHDMKMAYTTSEKLTPQYRATIEKAWGCQVMDCYGSRDGGITAFEIERGYYNVGYCAWLEADTDKPSELYATNLVDFAFPTIRYSNRDEVQLCDENQQTQYNGQCIKEVIGRTSDIIRLPNGHILTGPGFTILFRKFHIAAYCISQPRENTVLVQMQKTVDFKAEENAEILAAFRKHVGENIDIQLEYVDAFEPMKNGKRRFFMVSEDDSHAGQLNGRLITATIWYLFTATKKRQEPEYHALAA